MLQRNPKVKPYTYWTPSDLHTLIQMLQSGNSITEIARQLNRTNNGISSKMTSLGLARPHRVKDKDCVNMSFRVSKKFHQRFKIFCRERAGSHGETLETVMTAFMNQVK